MRIWAPALSEGEGSGWEPQSADSSRERWRGLEPVLRVSREEGSQEHWKIFRIWEAAACWDTGKEGIWQVDGGGLNPIQRLRPWSWRNLVLMP